MMFRLALGCTLPPLGLVLKVISAVVKRQDYEADHTPPSNVKFKTDGTELYIHFISRQLIVLKK
jgi:hypothetical protein